MGVGVNAVGSLGPSALLQCTSPGTAVNPYQDAVY
jgi:hypothetical protein